MNNGNQNGSRFAQSGAETKKKQRIIVYIVVGVLIAAAVTALVILLTSGSSSNEIKHTEGNRHDVTVAKDGGANAADIEGVWVLDNITSYEFDGKGRGVIHTAMDFPFSYSAENGELNIDVDTDDARDCRYDYTIDGIILTMNRGDATYVLTKVVK